MNFSRDVDIDIIISIKFYNWFYNYWELLEELSRRMSWLLYNVGFKVVVALEGGEQFEAESGQPLQNQMRG